MSTYMTIESGLLVVTAGEAKEIFPLTVAGAEETAAFLVANADHAGDIACSSSCDFPRESGAPKGFSFARHWRRIVKAAEKLGAEEC